MGAERNRPHEGSPDQEVRDPDEDRDRERHKESSVRLENPGAREINDAQAVEKLHDRVACERDESPEDERMHEPGGRPLADGSCLQDDVEEKAFEAEGNV